MVNKAKKGFYDNLSRKELQNMCKQFGLPANKSHSDLEKSLFAYLKGGINGSICNLQKASHSKCNRGSINHRKGQRKSSNEKFLSLSRDDVAGIMPQTKYRDIDNSRHPAENAFASSIENSQIVRSSSFEFYVRSEEGIDLCVDLNSSPSDWTQKFKNEIHICKNVQNNKCWSLHEDLGYLKEGDKQMQNSVLNMNAEEMKDGHIETRSSPSSKMTKDNQSKINELEKVETFLTPFTIQPGDVAEKSKEDQVPKSSELNSSVQDNIISVADSCGKDEGTLVLDSDVIGAHHIKPVSDSATNSISDYSLTPVKLDHLNSNLSQYQNTVLQNGCSHVNPSVVYPGCSVSGSIELQSSEVASCNKDASCLHCENGRFMSGFDRKRNTEIEKSRLANSNELDHNAYGCHLPVPAEEGERSNNLNERESSECSQFTKSSGKKCLSSDNLVIREGLQKKRKCIQGDQIGYGKANAKILRSMKRITRKDFPRRSMRLRSK